MPNTEPSIKLTSQEKAVFELVVSGEKSKDIAEKLYISKRTVDFHIANVYRKLGVVNKIQAYNKARELNLL